MNKKKLKRDLADIGKDILVAFVIVAIIMMGLYAYCGIWPPMVVVESGSMEHPPAPGVLESYVGVIDTGDMVFVKSVNGTDELVTYVQGEATDYSKYGTYGDVIIYRPNGLKNRVDGTPVVPIIHRLVIWLEINSSRVAPNLDYIDYGNYSFDAPSLGIYGSTGNITLTNYGYQGETVHIKLGLDGGLMKYYQVYGSLPHGGYITMGDNNAPAYDQPSYELVQPEWIIGKAWGELPWFGLVKLWFTGGPPERVASNSWVGLFFTLAMLIFLPLVLEFTLPRIKKYMNKDKEPDETQEPKTEPHETTPEEIDPGDEAEPDGTPEVIKEKETIIIKEIVKIPCSHCGAMVENTESKCKSCGAPIR